MLGDRCVWTFCNKSPWQGVIVLSDQYAQRFVLPLFSTRTTDLMPTESQPCRKRRCNSWWFHYWRTYPLIIQRWLKRRPNQPIPKVVDYRTNDSVHLRVLFIIISVGATAKIVYFYPALKSRWHRRHWQQRPFRPNSMRGREEAAKIPTYWRRCCCWFSFRWLLALSARYCISLRIPLWIMAMMCCSLDWDTQCCGLCLPKKEMEFFNCLTAG